jgi:hypothetical protein
VVCRRFLHHPARHLRQRPVRPANDKHLRPGEIFRPPSSFLRPATREAIEAIGGADIEDTVFNLAVSRPGRDRSLTVEGCRILARQFRDRVEAHQACAIAQVGHSQPCLFDLHTLPPGCRCRMRILQLGPTHLRRWLAGCPLGRDIRAKATTGRRLPAIMA